LGATCCARLEECFRLCKWLESFPFLKFTLSSNGHYLSTTKNHVSREGSDLFRPDHWYWSLFGLALCFATEPRVVLISFPDLCLRVALDRHFAIRSEQASSVIYLLSNGLSTKRKLYSLISTMTNIPSLHFTKQRWRKKIRVNKTYEMSTQPCSSATVLHTEAESLLFCDLPSKIFAHSKGGIILDFSPAHKAS